MCLLCEIAEVLNKLRSFNLLRWRSGFTLFNGGQIFWGSKKASIGVYGHARRLPAPPSVGTGAGKQGQRQVIFWTNDRYGTSCFRTNVSVVDVPVVEVMGGRCRLS